MTTHYQIVSGIKVVTRKGFTPKVKQMDVRLDEAAGGFAVVTTWSGVVTGLLPT